MELHSAAGLLGTAKSRLFWVFAGTGLLRRAPLPWTRWSGLCNCWLSCTPGVQRARGVRG